MVERAPRDRRSFDILSVKKEAKLSNLILIFDPFCPFTLTKPVAFNTGLALLRSL